MQDHSPLETLHLAHRALDRIGRLLRFVHQLHGRIEGRIELQNIVIDTLQRTAHRLAANHRRIAQHRHSRRGAQLIAQSNSVVDNRLKLRVHRRLAITRKCDHIGRRALVSHLAQLRSQQFSNHLSIVKTTRAAVIAIPAALAIDAVEIAQFSLCRQQIDAQRESQSARTDRAKNYVRKE